MQDFEKLGVFYLGRPYDVAQRKALDGVVLYDSSDLTTHAVCLGMTGSGKTGLCTAILEEAAIDGIPAIAIDLKGDIANLLLTFDRMSADQLMPWVSEEEARSRGLSVDKYASEIASSWQDSLKEFGQDRDRIKRLKDSAEFSIYTPGSSSGLPVSVLRSFNCPESFILNEPDLLKERVTTATSSLLSLAGIQGDQLRTREHILLSTVLIESWRNGQSLTLSEIIALVQRPPMTQIGAIDLESFFPARERLEFAMAINNLIASPGFETWMQGEPLDIGNMLYTDSGKPRISIFSVAHLSDSERMFFISLLLNEVVCFMRAQSGTQSLRAILYMDEIFGYFPPTANPPSKLPLLTLLKQARAYGLGVVLATQNPVDLDYKGLSNAGTWLIGRLQTERDKMRVLDGLENIAAENGEAFDRKDLDAVLSSLGKRVFLIKNVHEPQLETFETRTTLSYLRGPLSRSQIKSLMAERKKESTASAAVESESGVILKVPAQTHSGRKSGNNPAAEMSSSPEAPPAAQSGRQPGTQSGAQPGTQSGAQPGTQPGISPPPPSMMPVISAEIPQYFLSPVALSQRVVKTQGEQRQAVDQTQGKQWQAVDLTYVPMLYARGSVRFQDLHLELDITEDRAFLVPFDDGPVTLSWNVAVPTTITIDELENVALAGASFAPIPQPACLPRSYKSWSRNFQDFLSAREKFSLLKSASMNETSYPGESQRDFRIRMSHLAKEKRDDQARKLRAKYAPKLQALEDKIRVCENQVDRERAAVSAHDVQAAISIGATVLGAFLGRRRLSASTLGRATTAARGVERSARKRTDVDRAEANLEAQVERLEEMERQFQDELDRLAVRFDAHAENLQAVSISAKRQNVNVQLMALVWVPHVRSEEGRLVPSRRFV